MLVLFLAKIFILILCANFKLFVAFFTDGGVDIGLAKFLS